MLRPFVAFIFLAALSGCATHTVENMSKVDPVYDEVVNKTLANFARCFQLEMHDALGPYDTREAWMESVSFEDTAKQRIFALKAPDAIYYSKYTFLIAEFTADGPDQTHVIMRAPVLGTGYLGPTVTLALEVIRACGDLYGTGYDRFVHDDDPVFAKSYPVARGPLMKCLRDEFRWKVRRPAYLHASDSVLWVNSYVLVPTYRVWEARFKPEGDNATHVELRSTEGANPKPESLTGLLLQSLDKCAADPG
jgi:hypothetical protein